MILTLISASVAADLTFVEVGDTQTDGGELSVNWCVFPQIVADMNTHSPDVGLVVRDLIGGADFAPLPPGWGVDALQRAEWSNPLLCHVTNEYYTDDNSSGLWVSERDAALDGVCIYDVALDADQIVSLHAEAGCAAVIVADDPDDTTPENTDDGG